MAVTLRAGNRNVAESAEAALLASIDREELILSSWNRGSEVRRWLATRNNTTELSPELLEVLGLFDHWRGATVRDRAVATSGSYRRGFNLTTNSPAAQPEFSHIIDPRTARPAGHILSSTVVARDPATAGALATALSVLGVDESRSLATSLMAKTGGVEYLLLTRNGDRIASDGWSSYQAPLLRTAAYAASPVTTAGPPDNSEWNQNYQLDISLELARIDDFRYRRPYVRRLGGGSGPSSRPHDRRLVW
jgi:thiamine biosynthesis lipoprotein ApbE